MLQLYIEVPNLMLEEGLDVVALKRLACLKAAQI
jgi:hypothetical protein